MGRSSIIKAMTMTMSQKYNHNQSSFVSELQKKDVGSSHRGTPSQNRCSSNSILDFKNKLMEGTKIFCKFLEDISKEVRLNKTDALQPIYLLKRAFLLKKILMVMLKF